MFSGNCLEYCEQQLNYMKDINSVYGMEHTIERANSYQNMIELYRDSGIVKECPIFIKYKGEAAVDEGGVQRDMFSGFWEITYKKLFEGSSLLTPMLHPQIDLTVFPILVFGVWYIGCTHRSTNSVVYSTWSCYTSTSRYSD